MMPKFEVCAVKPAIPQIIEANDIDEAYEIASEMYFDDFEWFDIEITDVYEVEDGE